MKNRRGLAYLFALCVFAALLAGFFALRNRGSGLRVEVSQQAADPESNGAGEAALAGLELPLDLNGADAQQLQALPGIGPVLAERIVKYREEQGGFTCVEELLQVEGIGEKRLERILDYVVVEEQK